MAYTRTFKGKLPGGITCESCIISAENALKAHDSIKVTDVAGEVKEQILTIQVENNELPAEAIISALTKVIIDAGLSETCEDFEEIFPLHTGKSEKATPELVVEVKEESIPSPLPHTLQPDTVSPEKKRIVKRKILRPMLTTLLKASIGILSGAAFIGLMLSGVDIPAAAMYVMVGVSSLITLLLGAESYKATMSNIANLKKTKNLTMDVLYTVSSLVIVGSTIAGLFFNFMPMMMDAGPLIFGFKYGGDLVKEWVRSRTTNKTTLAERAAKTVWRKNKDTDEWEICDSGDIQIDDIIRVDHGQKIPVNGVLLSGHAWLRESIIDGSTKPKYALVGKTIYAGMEIPKTKVKYDNGDIIIRVTETRDKSFYADIENQSERLKKDKSTLEIKAQKYLKVFVPAVLAAAVISGVLIGVFLGPSLGIHFATSLLVALCPCVVGTAIPTSMSLGIKKAQNFGVRIKDTDALQKGSDIDTIVFDLNRTLTTGKLVVKEKESKFYDDDDTRTDRWFGIVAAIQRKGRHVFAMKIAEYAEKKSTGKRDYEVKDEDHSQNTGIKATVEGDVYHIGNSEFLKFHQIPIQVDVQLKGTEQITYVVKNNVVIGHFIIEDPLRPDAQFVVNEAKQMGIEVHICTGANEEVAQRIAAKLGVDPQNVYANSVGKEIPGNLRTKEAYIRQLNLRGKHVAMVGDGENDASALAASQFGIAVNATNNNTLAFLNASATIRNDNLLPVLTSIVVAKQSVRSANINLIISLSYNLTAAIVLGVLLIGIGFALNPAIGVALMVLQASVILLIQYGIYKNKMEHIKRYNDSLKVPYEPESTSTDMFRQRGLMGKPNLQKVHTAKVGDSEGKLTAEQRPLLKSVASENQNNRNNFPPLVYASAGRSYK